MAFKEKLEGITVLEKVFVKTKRNTSISLPTVNTTTDSAHQGSVNQVKGGPPDFFYHLNGPVSRSYIMNPQPVSV